jgi:hypothetical protein
MTIIVIEKIAKEKHFAKLKQAHKEKQIVNKNQIQN